jgi:hypothetical protein
VINLYNLEGNGVVNLGGVFATNGHARVPLTLGGSTQLSFPCRSTR